jgi:hypothetical protein
MDDIEKLRYPVGRFSAPASPSDANIPQYIKTLEDFPGLIRKETEFLDDRQLDTPYREGGWTIRQVVHHVADSHINFYCRAKLAMTEENPVIRPYFEDRWAELPEARTAPVKISLELLESIHTRLVLFLKNLQPGDFLRTYVHPEYGKTYFLYQVLANYHWHCNHHLAHITRLKQKMNW